MNMGATDIIHCPLYIIHYNGNLALKGSDKTYTGCRLFSYFCFYISTRNWL